MIATIELAGIPSFSLLLQQTTSMQNEKSDVISMTSNASNNKTTSLLEQTYFSHYSSLVSMARILVDDTNSASDVVQEAFVKALVIQPTFRNNQALSYMKTAVMNQARSHLRKRNTSRKHLSVVNSDDIEIAAKEKEEISESATKAQEILRKLPERQRECLALAHAYSMTHKEIAIQLGISEGSVKQHISRGLKALALALGGAQ